MSGSNNFRTAAGDYIEYLYTLTYDRGDGVYGVYTIDGKPRIKTDNPLLSELYKTGDYQTFQKNLDHLPYDKKISALNMLAKIAYKTYDRDGLNNPTAGRINTISNEEMYDEIRNVLFDPQQVQKTSVCRGIANFIAHLARDWGFESHSVIFQTGGLGHVLVMLRRPGETYQFIDRGEQVIATPYSSMEEALQAYILETGLPPQLSFTLYNSNGKYEKMILTKEGKELLSRTTPDRIEDFLKFRP